MKILIGLDWLPAITLRDPIEQRLAPLLQILLVGVVVVVLLTAPLFLVMLGPVGAVALVGPQTVAAVFAASALITLRHGRFQRAVILATTGLILALALALLLLGMRASIPFLVAFMFPISLAALLAGRRTALIVLVLSLGIVGCTALGEYLDVPYVGRITLAEDLAFLAVIAFVSVTSVISFFLMQFGSSLRAALTASALREQELEHLSASLETSVSERTTALQEALQTVQQREARLAQTLADLRASQETIEELSAPIIPVLPAVLVAPLIGALDSTRAAMLTGNVLRAVESQQARYVIFDITGVPIVDSQVAGVLINTASAVRLLGAQVLLVGIRPEVAQTMITLGIDLRTVVTYPDLQQAVTALLVGQSKRIFDRRTQ